MGLMKPKVYRRGPGRWMVQVRLLPHHVGPFSGHQEAFRWAWIVGRYWT